MKFASFMCGALFVVSAASAAPGHGDAHASAMTAAHAEVTATRVDTSASVDGTARRASPPAAGTTPTAKSLTGTAMLVRDGGFENGVDASSWATFSNLWPTLLCGDACEEGVRTGTYWALFGGSDDAETSALVQIGALPAGTTTLTFYLRATIYNGQPDPSAYFRVQLDDDTIFSLDQTTAASYAGIYTAVSLDVSQYADDAEHALRFELSRSAESAFPDIHLDDVQLGEPVVPVLVRDGGFEGSRYASWTQGSTLYGSPLCDKNCGESNARTGARWVWFGGAPIPLEQAFVEQTGVLPEGMNVLEFYVWWTSDVQNPADPDAHVTVRVDGDVVLRIDPSTAAPYAEGYGLVSVDVSAYADGEEHVLRFESESNGSAIVTNVHIDDIRLVDGGIDFADGFEADAAQR